MIKTNQILLSLMQNFDIIKLNYFLSSQFNVLDSDIS